MMVAQRVQCSNTTGLMIQLTDLYFAMHWKQRSHMTLILGLTATVYIYKYQWMIQLQWTIPVKLA